MTVDLRQIREPASDRKLSTRVRWVDYGTVPDYEALHASLADIARTATYRLSSDEDEPQSVDVNLLDLEHGRDRTIITYGRSTGDVAHDELTSAVLELLALKKADPSEILRRAARSSCRISFERLDRERQQQLQAEYGGLTRYFVRDRGAWLTVLVETLTGPLAQYQDVAVPPLISKDDPLFSFVLARMLADPERA